MVSQFPSPRILDTAIAQPIAFSCHRFLTYSTNEKLFGELKAQWVTTIFPQNKLCNAWPFSLNYSFFHSNFLIFNLFPILIYTLFLSFYGIPVCVRTESAWATDDEGCTCPRRPRVHSFFLSHSRRCLSVARGLWVLVTVPILPLGRLKVTASYEPHIGGWYDTSY